MPNLYLVTTPSGSKVAIAETLELAVAKAAVKEGVEPTACTGRVFSEIEAVE
jgi:hypothetical protein